jgi:hypothetical protein
LGDLHEHIGRARTEFFDQSLPSITAQGLNISNHSIPIVGTYRTLCMAPSADVRAVFDGIREFVGTMI